MYQRAGGGLMEGGGISISHSGPSGALLARGMIKDASTGYAASVAFADPANAKSSKLHGAGLRSGTVSGQQLGPIIVAHNIGNEPTDITGQITYTGGSRRTKGGLLKITSAQLQPGEVSILRPPALGFDVATAGLELKYSTVH